MPRKRTDYDHVELAKRPESPCWQFKYYDPVARKVRFRSTGTAERGEADRQLRELIRAGGVAALQTHTAARPAVLTVPAVLTAYYNEYACAIASAVQARIASKHLIAFFGNTPVADLSQDRQQEYVDERLGAGRAPKTIARELSVLRASLFHAREKGRLEAVPKIYELPDISRMTRWLTTEEFAKLLAAARSPHLALYLLLGVVTAGRPSAILDLRWDQIDFAGRIIHLNPWGRAQTNKTRPTVRMTEQLQTALLAAHPHRETDYVIEYAGFAVNSIRTAFEETAGRAGFAKGEVTPYTLRHTAATWMAKRGVPVWKIAQRLGHTSGRMVERYYAHYHPDFQDEAVAALEGELGDTAIAPQLHPKMKNRGKNAARRARRNKAKLDVKMVKASRGYLDALEMVVPTGIEPVTPTMST